MAIKFDVISSVLLRSIFLVSLRFCESYLLGIEIEIIVCVKPLKLFKHFLNLTEREKENFTTPLWKMGTHCSCNRHIRMLKNLEMIFPPLHTEKTPYWKITKIWKFNNRLTSFSLHSGKCSIASFSSGLPIFVSTSWGCTPVTKKCIKTFCSMSAVVIKGRLGFGNFLRKPENFHKHSHFQNEAKCKTSFVIMS